MKRIALLVALALIATVAHAEKVVGTFIMSGEEQDVEADYSDGTLQIYFDVFGEYTGEKVMMSIAGEENILEFIEKLKYCKSKFVEWERIALQNNVVDYSKKFDVTFPRVELWWKGSSDWYSSFEGEYFKPLFFIDDEGEISFIAGGEVSDWNNEYIDQKWYVILQDVSEIDSLIEAINPSRVISVLTRKDTLDALFQ